MTSDDTPNRTDTNADGIENSVDPGSVPDVRTARTHLLSELVRFVADLRNRNVSVPASGTLEAARALAVVGLGNERRVSAALRASLLSEVDDADAFEAAFPTFWHRFRSGFDRIATAHDGPTPADDDDPGAATGPVRSADTDADVLPDAEPPDLDEDPSGRDPTVRIPTSRRHASGDRPVTTEEAAGRRYSAVGESELVDAPTSVTPDADLAAISRFVDSLATLPGRRRRTASTGPTVDARGALRASLQTGGAPIVLPWTAPTTSELRCCLLVDVSGSVLDTIDRRALLGLAETVATTARAARVFLFDTDLIEATDAFRAADGEPAAALRAAEIEWGGGTRIGHAFDSLRRSAPHAVDRRTIVLVVSDGLDVGDQDVLADGVTWLADRARAVIWLNPLAVSRSFEPTSRGMSTVEPYVDALFGFAEAADLAEAARQLERRGVSGGVGYEYDMRRTDAVTDGGGPG